MNPTPSLWLHLLGLLAVQTALVIALAAALQPLLRPARWKHAAWLAALLGVALLFANALFGVDGQVKKWIERPGRDGVRFVVRGNLPVDHAAPAGAAAAGTEGAFPDFAAPSAQPPASAIWWPAWAWLAGVALLGARAVVFRLWLALIWRRRQIRPDAEIVRQVGALAARLGLRRRIGVVTSRSLAAPVAFGWWHPTIGLPVDFCAAHSRVEQDAMLVHELAHLAARDPLWLALADAATALLWWHPLVWWARHQFRTACEAAADEASLLLEDGPTVLASCLVNLAGRWQRRSVFGLLGMAGFRSGLGRRVERLLALSGSARQPAAGGRFKLAVLGGMVVVVLVVGTTAWALPNHGTPTLLVLAQQTLAGALAPAGGDTNAPVVAVPTTNLPAGENRTSSTVPTPIATNAAATRSLSALVQDGKLLYEMGKLNEAEAKLVQASDQEPINQTAAYYLNLVEQAMRQREAVAKSKLVEVEKAWNPPPLVSTQLYTRTYRVDPNTFVKNLEAIRGGAAGQLPRLASGATNPPVHKLLRDYFAAVGVDFGDPASTGTNGSPAGAQSPQGRAMFFNDRNGILLVRATGADMEIVETAVSLLNVAPPQVLIEAKFVEVTEDAGKALGFDWFLGTIGTNAPAATNGAATSGVFPGNPSLNSAATTNGARELRGDQLDWAGKDVTNAHDVRVTAALGAQFRGILTEAQSKVVLRALEQRAGTDVLSAPKVATLSGRQAQIQVVDLKTYVMGIDPKAVTQPGKRPAGATNALRDPWGNPYIISQPGKRPEGATNASPLLTAQVPTGPTLDVIPTVAADGYTIELKVIPTVTEFLGYDDPRMFQPQGGKSEALLPLPHFRVWQMETTARIWDGQTLVLGGLTSDEVQKTKDSVPVLGDLPLVGSLFRSESQQSVKKRLLVFVTATIIDPAGNRVHFPGELPFDPNAVPPQGPVSPR